MNVTEVSELLTEIDSNAPRSSLGFGLPNSLLLKWQSAGPDFHKKIPLQSSEHADVLLVWWLSQSQISATEADNLTAEYLLNLGAFHAVEDAERVERLPYDWLVRLFNCDRELSASQFRATLPSSFVLDRKNPLDFQIWIATIERILEMHSALGPRLLKLIAAFATTIMDNAPRDGVIAPLTLFGLIHDARPDLRALFDLTRSGGFHDFVQWFLTAGLVEYRLAFVIFLDWLRLPEPIIDAPFCGAAALPPLILQAATGLESELDLIDISDDPASHLAIFGWWLRAARNLVVNNKSIQARIELVRTLRAFWFHANFGVTRAEKSDIPLHLRRLHASSARLIAAYDFTEPEGRKDFIAWWERTDRHENPDFDILDREFFFSPALGVEQDLGIPITNAALHNWLSRDISFARFDLSTSLGRLNFVESFTHLCLTDQLPLLKRKTLHESGASEGFEEDLCNVARRIVSPVPLPFPATGHRTWWLNEQHNHLYRIGYNSHELRLFRETLSQSVTAVGASALVDVEVAGFPRAESGQGEDARTVFQSLKLVSDFKLSLFHTRRWIPTPNRAAADLESFIAPDLQNARVRIFALSAFDMLAEEQFEGLSAFSAKHLIGYWPWELSRWPAQVSLPHRIVDEIWCSTRFTVDSLTPATRKPVIHMPLPVTIDMAALPGADASDLPRDRFNFLFVFDGFSYFERKNPLAVISAFQRAFPIAERHDVGLTIKAMNADQLPVLMALKIFASTDSRINLIYETWDRPRVMQLVASADVLVSLHRSEGFGRLMAEAMLLETPVIVSDYSGNRDFCTDETAFMVGGQLKPVREDEYIFWKGQEWFDPSVEQAARHMRLLFDNPAIATGRVKAARENIQQNYSLEACGRRYAARIADILAAQ